MLPATALLGNCLAALQFFAASPETATPQDTAVYQLPSVVVTATRSSVNWLDAPLAFTVIRSSSLVGRKGIGLDDALGTVAGVLAQSRSGAADVRVTIRGFGARGAGERSNAGTSRGVRVLLDGFPETEPDGRTSFDLIDLATADKIEVVRSNISAVWGNASGGVVNISTRPAITSPFVKATTTFGNFGFRKYSAQSGLPLSNGSLLISLTRSDFDGWRDHSGSSRSLLNASILSALDQRMTLGVYVAAADHLFRIPGPLTKAEFDADPRQAQADTANYNPSYVGRDERRRNRLGRLGVRLTRALGAQSVADLSFFMTPKVLQRSERNTFRDFTRNHLGGSCTYQRVLHLSERLVNSALVGIDEAYQDGAILFYNLANGERGTMLKSDKREGAGNFGIFIQDELQVEKKLSLLLGARWDAITYYYDDYINPSLNARKSFKQLTPKVGATFRVTPTLSIYANFAQGIEVPAGNETDPPSTFGEDTVTALNPLLTPIRSTTVEVGVKQSFTASADALLRALTCDVALYRIKIDNDIIPYRGGRFYFTAGETRRLGAEVTGSVELRHGVTALVAATFCRSEYVEYVVDSVHYGKPGRVADFSGNRMAGQPDYFFRSSLKYAPSFARGLFFEFSTQGVGEYSADDADKLSVPSYLISNTTVGWEQIAIGQDDFTLDVRASLNNITDRKYAASAYINPDLNRSGQPIYLEPGLARNWVISVWLQHAL